MKRFPLLALLATVGLFFASCGGSHEGSEASVTDATTPAETPAAASSYKIDTQNSTIGWKGSKVTGSSHEGTIKLSDGSLNVENGQLVGGSFTIDMQSLDNTDLKGSEGYDKLIGHLKSPDFFSVDSFPTATFDITSVTAKTGDANATHDISGNLTVKGISKNLTFPAKVTIDANTLNATAAFFFDRSLYNVKFGSESFFKGLGDNAINNNIDIKLDLKATPAAL